MKRSFQSNNCQIVYDISRRENAPAVVLLHGYGVHRRMWQDEFVLLKPSHTVLNIDVRGHGESRPCPSFSIPEAACDLRRILAAEHLEHAVFIGLSMGGYIVQEYAFRYGGGAGYLLIGNTPALLNCYSPVELFALRHSASLFQLYPWGYLKDVMTKGCVLHSEARQAIRPMFDVMNKREFITFWKGITRCLHEERFQFDAPLLVSCGERDTTGTIRKCLPQWQRSYSNCETVIFPNAAHVANLDNPQAVHQTILAFIRRCTEKAP